MPPVRDRGHYARAGVQDRAALRDKEPAGRPLPPVFTRRRRRSCARIGNLKPRFNANLALPSPHRLSRMTERRQDRGPFCESSGVDSSGFIFLRPSCTLLPAEFSKFFFDAKSGVPDAAFVPAAQGASTVKRAARAPANDIFTCRKRPFHRHICNSEDERRKSPSRRGRRATARPRGAECVAFSMRTTALRTRFLDVEDVFFLCAVVIENAVPTIRVGAEATPATRL
jgi:hypothetical protein